MFFDTVITGKHFTYPQFNLIGRYVGEKSQPAAVDTQQRNAERSQRPGSTENDAITPHGNQGPVNETAETRAILRVFGEVGGELLFWCSNAVIGHSLGGLGGLEAAAALRTIRDGVIHPTINYETPDPDCDLDYVPNVARKVNVNTVLSNSFGFGGQNACIVLRRFERS